MKKYTAKTAEIATKLLTSCNRLDPEASIRMGSHGLRQVVNDKFILKTCYPQACCKLFQQVVISLQMTQQVATSLILL